MSPTPPVGLIDGVESIRRGASTSHAWTRACLARIVALEPRVEAFEWLDPELALAKAEAADRRSSGILRGAPIGIKDVFDTEGVPTRMGSAAYADRVPQHSARAVQRLENASAFVLGKTVSAELAFYTPGKTRNPWNPAHTPGGSSSGSAAAVAAGFAPAALGTQTNGSIIRPAAYCGCVGFKPSFGRVPCDGVLRFSRSLDHVGFLTRRVADAALLLDVCGDADARTSMRRVSAPRLIAVRTPVWDHASQDAREHFADTLDALRAAGARVEERELPPSFAAAHALHRTIMYAEGARSFAELARTRAPLLSDVVRAMIQEGAAIPEDHLSASLDERDRLAEALDEFMQSCDAIVTPSTTGEAPGTCTTTGDPRFCTLWTLCGVPALTLPSGRGATGLPLGTQIVGRARRDADLLETAGWCEHVLTTPAGPFIAMHP